MFAYWKALAASYRLYSFGHTHSRFMSRHREQVGLQKVVNKQALTLKRFCLVVSPFLIALQSWVSHTT
jgi:hypothetical protein